MASRKPIIKQIAWSSLFPQILVILLLMYATRLLGASEPILAGAILYLIVSFCLRFIIPFHHRKGMRLIKKDLYKEAIPFFENSYAFFANKKWIDRWRCLILLSSSRISYKEMALINIAFCYTQIGEGAKAKETYERALLEFPESEIAKVSLKIFESAKGFAEQINPAGPAQAPGS